MKNRNNNPLLTAVLWAVFFLPVLWAALLIADCYAPGDNIIDLAESFSDRLLMPFPVRWTQYSTRAVAAAVVLYGGGISAYYATRGNYRRGEEHGTAVWQSPGVIASKYSDRQPCRNLIFTKSAKIGMNTRKHLLNLNILVLGGSGSGKTRFFCKPNVLNCADRHSGCSFLITDPKGEILRATGHFLKENGYDVKVLNLINMDASDSYNPHMYLESDEDIFKLITNLIRNTTPKNAQNQDPFWEKSETALLSALLLFLFHEAPEEERNFTTIMYMIENGGASEEDESFLSPLDLMFSDLEHEDPEHIAVKEYKVFKQAAGKTAKSILVSAAVRLAVFNLPKLQNITNQDELDIGSLGERRRAIFAVIPDNDDTFNFIIGMLYTQAFQALYRKADYEYGGRLPVHVRIIMDEFSNVANLSPDDFLRVLSTMRSREISVSIIIQNMAQLKKQFGQEAWESVPGCCDSLLYLGGNELGSHEYVSKLMGKSTIDTRTSGQSKGRQGSYTQNYQNAGRELMTPDEVRRLSNKNALLFIRGESPVIDKKYDLLKHPNVKYTEDGGALPYVHKEIAPLDFSRVSVSYDTARPEDYEIL